MARFLETHNSIEKVNHPLLTSHPDHELAKVQNNKLHSGVFSFYIKGGTKRTDMFMASLKLIDLAVSLGGVHTTACVPVKLSHSFLTKDERRATGITENLVRISVGIENIDDIKADLEQALKKANEDNTNTTIFKRG